MSRALGSRSLLLFTLLTWSCAAHGPSRRLAAEVGRADALLRDGCYRCLEEAHAIYERAAASHRAPSSALRGAFESALLLAIRSKELGLPSDASFERARTWARRLPPAAVPAHEPFVLVNAAELLIGELSGFDPEERQRRDRAIRPEMRAENPHRRALDPVLDTSLVAAYVALSIDCERVPRQQAPERKARLGAAEQKRAASSEHLASQSAFNAAQCYLRLGQKQPALTHVEAAAAHPLMRDKATALKVIIEKMR